MKILLNVILEKIVVGADAHIGPADCAVFTEICGEFVTSQRADVGIGPYKQVGSYGTNLPKVFRLSQLPAATSQALRASSTFRGALGGCPRH